ncbi:hypothetical protein MJH12_00900 [bacterium]|nr:hypothetical protein [bacterium]
MKHLQLGILIVLHILMTSSFTQASIDLDSLEITNTGSTSLWSIQNKTWSLWTKDVSFSNKVSYLNPLKMLDSGLGYYIVGQGSNELRPLIMGMQAECSVKIKNKGWAFLNLANSESRFLDVSMLKDIKEITYYDRSKKEWVSWNGLSSESSFEIPKYQSFWLQTKIDDLVIAPNGAQVLEISGDVKALTSNLSPALNFKLQSDFIEKVSNNSYMFNKEKDADGFYLNVNAFHSQGVYLEYLKVEEIRVSHGVSKRTTIFSRRSYDKAFTNERVFVNPNFDEYFHFVITSKVLHSDVKEESFELRVKDQRLTPLKNLFNNLKRSARSRSASSLSANEIDMIELSVSGEGISPTRVETYPANTTEARISIIAGNQRTFLVRFIDAFGDVIKQAATTIDVLNTLQTPIALATKSLNFQEISLSHLEGQYFDSFDLQLSISSGKLFYTLDGSNPKLVESQTFETNSTSIHMDVSTNLRVFIEEESGRRSGVFNFNYELGGSPTIDLTILSPSYQNKYLSPSELKFTSNFSNTKVYYSLDGSLVTSSSEFGVAPFSIVLTNASTISYFGESSLGYQSAQDSIFVDLLDSIFSSPANIDLNVIGNSFENKYIWPVDLQFTSNLPETKIFYSTDSSNVTTLSSFVITPASFSLSHDTDLKYFSQSVVGLQSELVELQFLGFGPDEINPNVQASLSKPGVSQHYEFPLTLTFLGTPGTTVFYSLDGNVPTTASFTGPVPLDIVLTNSGNIQWFGSVGSSLISSIQSLEVLALDLQAYSSGEVLVDALGNRTYSGLLLGGESLILLVDGQNRTNIIQISPDQTAYTYQIPASLDAKQIELIVSNEDAIELTRVSNVIANPRLNNIMGGPSYGLPSQYFPLGLIGGFGAATFDYENQNKVFYNSLAGSLFKIDQLGTVSLIRNFEKLAEFRIQSIIPSLNLTDPDVISSIQDLSESRGAISASSENYIFSAVKWLEVPSQESRDGQMTNNYLGSRIYQFDGQNVVSVAGMFPQSNESYLDLKD